MRRKILLVAALIITFLFLMFTLSVILVSAVPKIEPYVNDFANVLTQEQISSLNLLIDEIEKNTTWEIAIVSVPNTEGMDRLEYANKIGDENGVGKLDKDNGLVVLWSAGDDKGLAIASGRYSESIFNDAKLGRILRTAKPYFDNQNYYEGYLNITLELKKEIVNPTNETDNSTTNSTSNLTIEPELPELLVIIILIIIGVLIFIFVILPSGGWSSGGGSSSGGSFGGGSFGGGGAKA
jgi:uncharacterized protein